MVFISCQTAKQLLSYYKSLIRGKVRRCKVEFANDFRVFILFFVLKRLTALNAVPLGVVKICGAKLRFNVL